MLRRRRQTSPVDRQANLVSYKLLFVLDVDIDPLGVWISIVWVWDYSSPYPVREGGEVLFLDHAHKLGEGLLQDKTTHTRTDTSEHQNGESTRIDMRQQESEITKAWIC